MRLGPGTRVGPYEVLSLLGSGGMGEVYRVRDHRMARDVALKIMPAAAVSDDDRLWRFETEVRTAGMLSHPNLLTIHDVGTFEGSPFLVSELLEGETLRETINRHAGLLGGRGGGLPVTSVLAIARQLASGLAAAHAAGIVHRDLKPDNVFVVRDGRVKILDFGLAKPQEPSATAQTSPMRTAPGTVLGTPGYMAPEQVRGDVVDARADLFALGAILYELLAGRQAFEGPSAMEAMARILRDEPPPLAAVPPLLHRTVLRCLEKLPERRFQSANDLLFVLEQAAETPASGEYPQVVGRALPRFRKITFRRGHIMSARFAPDGTIVYGAAWEGQSLEVFQARRGNPESRSLGLPAGDVLAVSSDGELALSLGRRYLAGFESSGTLARVQLPGGAPREILRSVQDCDWSPDGRRLAVIRRAGDLWRLEYPLGTVLVETPRWISAVRISPDDRAIAFLEHRVLGDDAARVVIVDRNGKTVAQSAEWPSTGGLAWHPRTGEVWVAAEIEGGRDLVAFSPSGETRIVYNVPGRLTVHDISADGRALLAYEVARRGMIAVSLSESSERNLSWFDWSYPGALSADGRCVLFEEHIAQAGTYSMHLRDTDGGAAVRLGEGRVRAVSPDGRYAIAASLSPPHQITLVPTGAGDARSIVMENFESLLAWHWRGDDEVLVWAHEQGQPLRLFGVDLRSGRTRVVIESELRFPSAIDARGDRLAAVRVTDDRAVVFSLSDGKVTEVAGGERGDVPLAWAEDGSSLFVLQQDGATQARIFRAGVTSAVRELHTTIRPSDPAGILGVGPVLIAPAGDRYVYGYRRFLSDLYVVDNLH